MSESQPILFYNLVLLFSYFNFFMHGLTMTDGERVIACVVLFLIIWFINLYGYNDKSKQVITIVG